MIKRFNTASVSMLDRFLSVFRSILPPPSTLHLPRILFVIFLLLPSTLYLSSCGGGDDDGRRLGEIIVGTWQRGWGEGDVIIEGETDLTPENFTYDQFVFNDDGSYNGMVRNGTFIAYDTNGNVIIDGSYQCDNHNMRLVPNGEAKMLAQVVFFTDTTLQLKYTFEEYNITVTFIIRKLSAQ